nr:alpha/beta hydrolase [Herbiconiux ginsengi]
MAADAVAVIRTLGLERVDLFGLSMGGMVAQSILGHAPNLVDRMILAGSGPEGGPSLTTMTGVTIRATARAIATGTDPKRLLFFTRSPLGRSAATSYLRLLKERTAERDAAVTPAVFRALLGAVEHWGHQTASPTSFAGS